MGENIHKFKKNVGSAILKVKYIGKRMNPEVDMFEDIVSSSNTVIKIEFNDGISLMEDRYRKVEGPFDKFFLEFFDDYNKNDFVGYLSSDSSDFRATTVDGVIVRLCQNDLLAMEMEKSESISLVTKDRDKYKKIFQKIKRMLIGK